jgi:hemolysin activation/secretion protein
MGVDILVNTVNNSGAFYTYMLKLGNYLNDDLIEDAEAQLGVSRYSKLVAIKNNRLRNYTDLNFASQLNQTLKPKLDINDINGVMGFKPDSLQGSKRLRLRNELVLYTTLKPWGFHLAPLINIDLAFIGKQYDALLKKENFYSGFSGGVRARNENLIFNTLEARVYYYPNTVENIEHWQAEIRISKRLKYPTSLVKAPATIYETNR